VISAIYSLHIDVPPDAIDANRHVNNLVYLKWMQDVAVAHSAAVGWPMDRYFRIGATWVVRSHFVEYLRPAFEGDALRVHTWVDGMEERRSLRRYLFRRERDGAVMARAETLWVFVDVQTGRPRRIPESLRADFTIVEGGERVVREELDRAAASRG
jgi:acyl-CoA thioester hydrolase